MGLKMWNRINGAGALLGIALACSGCLASMLMSKKTKHDWVIGTGEWKSSAAWDVRADVQPNLLVVEDKPDHLSVTANAGKGGYYETMQLTIAVRADARTVSQRADASYRAIATGDDTYGTSPSDGKLFGLKARKYSRRVQKTGDMGDWGTTSHWWVADLGKCSVELFTQSNRHGANHKALDDAAHKNLRGIRGKLPNPAACR